jgi:hypothetical protein
MNVQSACALNTRYICLLLTEGQSLVSSIVLCPWFDRLISGVVMCARYKIEGNQSGLFELVLWPLVVASRQVGRCSLPHTRTFWPMSTSSVSVMGANLSFLGIVSKVTVAYFKMITQLRTIRSIDWRVVYTWSSTYDRLPFWLAGHMFAIFVGSIF